MHDDPLHPSQQAVSETVSEIGTDSGGAAGTVGWKEGREASDGTDGNDDGNDGAMYIPLILSGTAAAPVHVLRIALWRKGRECRGAQASEGPAAQSSVPKETIPTKFPSELISGPPLSPPQAALFTSRAAMCPMYAAPMAANVSAAVRTVICTPRRELEGVRVCGLLAVSPQPTVVTVVPALGSPVAIATFLQLPLLVGSGCVRVMTAMSCWENMTNCG